MVARAVDQSGPRAGVEQPDWHYHPRGQECGACRDWRDLLAPGTPESELYDKVGWLLSSDGLDALADPNRHFRGLRFQRGLGEELGIGPWIDSGQPAGERWAHLAAIAERLERERAEDAGRPAGPTWDEVILAGAVPAPTTTLRRELVDGRWQTVKVQQGDYNYDEETEAHERNEVLAKQYARQGGGR